jgi:ABC-type nitrate/sulfonate/bicarbonate transport system permease component
MTFEEVVIVYTFGVIVGIYIGFLIGKVLYYTPKKEA